MARGDPDRAPLDRAEGRIAPIDAPLTSALPIAFGGFAASSPFARALAVVTGAIPPPLRRCRQWTGDRRLDSA